MSQLPAWFSPQYTTRVQHKMQQTKSLLEGTVMNNGTVKADQIYFPNMGILDTVEPERLQELILQNPNLGMVNFGMKPYSAAAPIWWPDMDKIQQNSVEAYADAGVSAINRRKDKIIIDALASTDTAVIGDGTEGMSIEFLMQIIEYYADQDGFDPTQLTVVMGVRDALRLGLDIRFSSSEFTAQQGQVIASTTSASLLRRPWANFNIVALNRLPLVANVRTGFAYRKDGVGYGNNTAERTEIDRVPLQMMTLVNTWFQAGAGLIDKAKVVPFKVKANAPIEKPAEPVLMIEA